METSAFKQAELALAAGGEQALFDVLAQTFMQNKDYAKLFQLRVLRKRFELGLPLIQNGPVRRCLLTNGPSTSGLLFRPPAKPANYFWPRTTFPGLGRISGPLENRLRW